MTDFNIGSTTTPSTLSNYTINPVSPDSPQSEESRTSNPYFTKYFGHYKKVAKIKKAIDGYATWILGQGYETDVRNKVILEHVSGQGEDTFNNILWNAIVTKKIGGDAYIEVIRDEKTGTLLNLKSLNPEFMTIVRNSKGRIKRYEYNVGVNQPVKYAPENIFRLSNNRVVDEALGVSDIEAVQWIVEFQEEAIRDLRKMLHRNGVVRVIEVDIDDITKIATFKAQWKDAIEKGDVLILPKGVAEAKDWHGNLDIAGILAVIEYLDSLFYMSIGVPRVILGGAENSIEASSKIGFLSFEQVYIREQTELEADIWNQLQIRLTFNKPVSIKAEMSGADAANTSQTGFQPNDTTAGVGK